MFRKRKFAEEEVVEETTTETTETEESTPDSMEQFINLLVDMGLSAEQAEAVHTMAMELVDVSGGETITEEVKEETKVEASRQGRGRRQSPRREFSRRGAEGRRARFSRDEEPTRGRLAMSEQRSERTNPTQRLEVQLRRQRREMAEMRKQLIELGAQPATRGLSNAPQRREVSGQIPTPSAEGSIQDRVNSMLKNVR